MEETEGAVFVATVPDIQGAIKIGRTGIRLQLEIPDSELGDVLKIASWREQRLKVVVMPDGDE